VTAGARVPFAVAFPVAADLVARMSAPCERVAVAGSLRRGKGLVGDIEIVAMPWLLDEPDGLWGTRKVSALDRLLSNLVAAGLLAGAESVGKVAAMGERYQKFAHVESGLQVDLFIVRPPAQWGVIFLIRTGPAEFSQWLVTEARRRHFHVTGGALHRGSMGCIPSTSCEVVDTPDEPAVFAALGMEYLRPAERGVARS
jgi:DNA polymerase (family 10)